MSPTKELSVEIEERIIKLPQEGSSAWSMEKDVGYSQSAASEIWSKYKQNGGL